MNRLVVLNLGQGNLYEGFPVVTAYIGEEENIYRMKFSASLPAAPEIPELYRNWKSLYSAFYYRPFLRLGVEEIDDIDDTFEIEEDSVTNISEVEIHELCKQVYNCLNRWLNSVEFRKIEQQLRTHFQPSEEIRFIVETNDSVLRRLPWHLWNFFDDYPLAEVALSASEYQKRQKSQINLKSTIRILAIFGNTQEIDISQDRIFLEILLTGAEIKFLVEPTLDEFNNQLWQQNWDILFFAGHSSCTQEKGSLQLNHKDIITLDQLKYGLKQAISRGLYLAIFNSCDGLGLAQQLQELHIPQVIVMREPVPNVIAQEFLKYFLTEFSQGESLYTAVRSARERLQGLEGEYPCATWLPVICQNPAEPPMVWNRGVGSSVAISETKQGSASDKTYSFSRTIKQNLLDRHRLILAAKRLSTLLLASVLVASSIIGVRHLGMLQPWELHSYDYLMHLRSPNEKPDPRLLIVTIDEADIQYQINKKMNMRWSLSDQALSQLLQKLKQYQPATIGIDIYRDFPVDPNYPQLSEVLQQDKRIFTVCKVSAPNDGAPDGTPASPKVSKERISFSDFVADTDGVLRRQLVQLTPPLKSPCAAQYALSFQLAQHYLNAQGMKWDINPDKNLQIGDTVFQRLQSHTSGYQGVDASGYQILLNYRSLPSLLNIAEKISLKELLNEEIVPELLHKSVKNRIVLIGVIASSSPDDWETPYTANAPDEEKQTSGVFLQAHMVSHILSAVLDGRPLMWWWSQWLEALWVWGWSLVGGIISWRILQPLHIGLAIAIALLILFGICFGIFTQAGWIPLVPSTLALVSCAVVLKILASTHASNSKKRWNSRI
ncbi:transmembrane sensor domain-containing protein [Brasilonema octagenarum UFV-E1]|uniref:Transmembrane sensor domain-containing protein n=2 Tax=Bromeliae group (in: Brasilonema) TaxID=3398495 RepID=A0A856MJE3_9CYAN|nr:transmembrane sensor domain-containing protein [Brasilonema sennae CENA114]QDL15615.1 transmembrane sensor domain-containing protein [Brasilonema octagenarum UFV-E1]